MPGTVAADIAKSGGSNRAKLAAPSISAAGSKIGLAKEAFFDLNQLEGEVCEAGVAVSCSGRQRDQGLQQWLWRRTAIRLSLVLFLLEHVTSRF